MSAIVLAIIATVMVWAFSPVSLTTVVLLAVAILLLVGLKRPVWALAALLVSELTLTSYMVGTPLGFSISLRLLLVTLIGFILWHSFAHRQIKLGPGARHVIIPALIFLGLTVIANLVNSGFDYIFKDFRNMVVGILIVIFLPVVTRSLKDLKLLCSVVLIGIIASSVIALMQHYQLLRMDEASLIPGSIVGMQGRVSGMAEQALYLAFTLPVIALAAVGVFLTKGGNNRTKWLLGASVVLMVGALYFTYTRSALLGLGFGLLTLPFFLMTRIRWQIILPVFLLGLVLIEVTGIMGSQYLTGREQAVQEDSAYERKVLWQAGIAIAWDNPILGIGGGQFRTISPQYASSVDPELMKQQATYWEYRTLGNVEPHNDFLMVWVSYGTLALLVYLWLYIVVLKNFFDSYRASNIRFIRGLSIGLATGLIAYMANAFYHNCMVSTPLLWILAGFSLATSKLAWKKASSKLEAVERSNEC
jgi:O-antigen ligase